MLPEPIFPLEGSENLFFGGGFCQETHCDHVLISDPPETETTRGQRSKCFNQNWWTRFPSYGRIPDFAVWSKFVFCLFSSAGFGNKSWYLRSFIFSFFQHFLQQYRRHRIHSFTNTKHTTTLVAAVKKRGEGGTLPVLDVASSAQTVLPFAEAWLIRSTSGLPFWDFFFFFAAQPYDGPMGKRFLSQTRRVVKQNVSRRWPEHDVTPNERKQEWRLKEEVRSDSVSTKGQFHHSIKKRKEKHTLLPSFLGYSAEKSYT